MMPPEILDPPLRAVCAGCGVPCGEDTGNWLATINLTPDTLLMGACDHGFEDGLVEMDIAFDWCSLPCFGRWLFRAASTLGAEARP